MKKNTKMPLEVQYQSHFDNQLKLGPEALGTMASARWRNDPKLLGITLSRYKFVSKMFINFNRVLEVGAGDAWFSRVVSEACKELTLSDFDSIWLDDFNSSKYYMSKQTRYVINDFTKDHLNEKFDGIYALDVLEHIKPNLQNKFLNNICRSLTKQGSAIFGMPSLESQKYASAASREGHVNCQSGEELYRNLNQYFSNVFMFSMSDEVVHTGFMPMAHYLIALCINPRKDFYL